MTKEIVQIIGNGDPGGGTTAVLTLANLLQGAVRGLDFSARCVA